MLGAIYVAIDSPPSRKLIHYYSLLKKTREIVHLLSRCRSIPQVRIFLSDLSNPSSYSHWGKSYIPHASKVLSESITVVSQVSADGLEALLECDYEMALLPFCGGVRGVKEVLIYANFQENNMKHSQEMAERCFVLMQREKSTRTDPDPHQVLQDDVQQRLTMPNVHFERILDVVSGYEANIMRRNRFAQWFGDGNGRV